VTFGYLFAYYNGVLKFICDLTMSLAPEVLEPVRRQCRVDGRARDRPMAEPSLDRPGVVALVGQRVAAGVAQHVGMGLDLKLGASRRALGQSRPW
jgi:hypothetical protein